MGRLSARMARLEQREPATPSADVASAWALQRVSDGDLDLLEQVARARQAAGLGVAVTFTPEQQQAVERFNILRQQHVR